MPLPLTSQSFDHEDYSTAPPELEPPFDDGPLADGIDDLHINDIDEVHCDEEDVYDLNSPPRSKKVHGKKRQLPSSPTPLPPQSVACPSHISNHNSHSLFKSHANQVIIHESAPSATSSSQAEQSDSSSPHFPNFILQETKQQGVESMHSEKLALYQLKNKCLMVKLNANCQDKEHHLLCEEHTHECVDAVLVHQWLLENKAQEIHLWEADAKALKLEMEVMLLHIEYTKLKKQ
ncbi:hypothetical protein BDR07DRAFT_1494921 [Suillus spraguei]|nr:hypothetical protein BDR07DRAFT_1494921 [Suillus spraguei]